MTQTIVVQTGARLHFGFLSYKPVSGLQFGGAGAMIDSPGFEVVVHQADEFSYQGPPIWRERVEKLISMTQKQDDCGSGSEEASFAVEVKRDIPPHIGLGSGTQLAMSLAAAVSKLQGEGEVSPEILASRVSRGARSAIGIHGFACGGFVHEVGKRDHQEIGRFAGQFPIPSEWRFMLVTPPVEMGLTGHDELEAFARLPPMPRETMLRLQRLLVADIIPALAQRQFIGFSEALYEFGRTVGDYFSPLQGGTFSSRSMADLVRHLREQGLHGIGQTSWGPTIFVLCESDRDAGQVARDVQNDVRWSGCQVRVVSARNKGADVIVKTV